MGKRITQEVNKVKRGNKKLGLENFIGLGFLILLVAGIGFLSSDSPGRPEVGGLAETKEPAFAAVSIEVYDEFVSYLSQDNTGAAQAMVDSGQVLTLPAGFPLTYLGIESVLGEIAKVRISTGGMIAYTSWPNLQEYVEKGNKNTTSSIEATEQTNESKSHFEIGDKVSSNNELWVASSLGNWEKIKGTVAVNTGNEEMEKNKDIAKFPDDFAVVTNILDEFKLFGIITVKFNNQEWYVDSSYLRKFSEEAYEQEKAEQEAKENESTAKGMDEEIKVQDIINNVERKSTLTTKDGTYHVLIYKDPTDSKYRLGVQRGEEAELRVAYHFDSVSFDDMYVLNGNDDILTLVSPDERLGTKVQHFFIKGGKLTRIKDTEQYSIFPQNAYKYSRSGDFYQTAFQAHGVGGWYFINLKLNKEEEKIDVQETVFEGYPSPEDEIGKNFLNRWQSDEIFILTEDMY